MPLTLPDVPVNGDGLADRLHIASHHITGDRVTKGEVTLCGYFVDYGTWRGEAPDAKACDICFDLDA